MSPTCQHCHQPIPRRPNDSVATWHTRRYCNRACQVAEQRRALADHRAHIIGEVEFLHGTDYPDAIARRLGYANADNLANLLYRWGRADVARRLGRSEVAA
jgi:hypothetical protein